MHCWPYSLGHRNILVRCSLGIDYFISLGISSVSLRAHCWYSCIWTWVCLIVVAWGLGLSDFKCLYHFLRSLLPSRMLEFSMVYLVWLEWELYWYLGQDEYRFKITVCFRKFSHDTSKWGRRKERQGFCSVVSVYETHLNAHPLFCSAPVLLMSSPPFLSCPLTDCLLQSLN